MERKGGEMQQKKRESEIVGAFIFMFVCVIYVSSAAIGNTLYNSGCPFLHDNIFPWKGQARPDAF